MKDKNSLLLNNLFIIGVGTIFTRLISFIMTPFYSSWLSTSDYGSYDLIATYVSLCVPFVTMQLDQAIYRFSIENTRYSNYYYRIIVRFVFPISIISAILSFIVMGYLNFSNSIIFSFVCYFLAMSYFNITAEYLRGNGKLINYSFLNIAVGTLSIILSVLFLKIFHLGVSGLLLVFAFSYAISVFLAQLLYRPYRINEKDDTTIKKLLHYSIPLIPNNISWWVTNVSDRTLINLILGSFYNGVYAICCKIPTMLSLLFGIFNLSFQQVALQNVSPSERKPYFNQLIKNIIKLLFSGSIMIVAFTPIIYHLFLDEGYWSGINCVPILICGAVFLSIAQYLGDILLVKMKTKAIGGSTICAAIINILLNLIAIPVFGLLGASLATMISYIVMFSIRLFKSTDIINAKKTIFYITKYILIYTIFSLLIIYFKDNRYINISITAISFVYFMIANRTMIKAVYTKLIQHN